MKNIFFGNSQLRILPVILSVVIFASCASLKWVVPTEYVGQWNTGAQKITVRTHPKGGYEFTSDSSVISIEISSDKAVSGSIGFAKFQNGRLKRNSGNHKITGVAYIVKCGRIGKIFESDPLETKEVEIWLSPIKEEMKAELRYTEGPALFPMGGLIFIRR